MGISFNYIDVMDQKGLFARGGIAILDVGASNLYSATPDRICQFVRKYNPGSADDLDGFAKRFAAGSAYDPGGAGVLNESWAGELFEKAGMHYVSFDIAQVYKTTVLDLNRALLPSEFRSRFDLVLNFGTTEHIFNQLNAFRIIHEAMKVGGFVYHQLPASGFTDHGYFTYTGRFFFDLAGFNDYEIFEFWLDGPAGFDNIWQPVKSYRNTFPALERALSIVNRDPHAQALAAMDVPNIAINIIYRKVKDAPFMGAIETSTSVGTLWKHGLSAYEKYGEPANARDALNNETPVPLEAMVAVCHAEVRKLRREMDQLKRYLAIFRPLRPILDRFLRR